MPEPDCFLRNRISAGTRHFTPGKSDVCVLAAAATRGFTMVLFTEPVSRRNTSVKCTCAPPSALLVIIIIIISITYVLTIIIRKPVSAPCAQSSESKVPAVGRWQHVSAMGGSLTSRAGHFRQVSKTSFTTNYDSRRYEFAVK